MSRLKYRQQKIQEKRKQTSFRDFLKLGSWYPFVFYKTPDFLSRYDPSNGRGQNIISIDEYYDSVDTFSDRYHKDYSGDLFEDLAALLKIVPLCATKNVGENPNCTYADIVFFGKNVYLSSVVLDSENVLYSFQVKNSKNVYNSVMVWKGSDHVYCSRSVFESYNIFYSSYVRNSHDVRFSSNVVGCNNCINCHSIENKSYCIDNVVYSKEIYEGKKALLLQDKDQFMQKYESVLTHTGHNIACEVVGAGNIMCEQVEAAYWCSEVKDGRNIFLVGGQGVSTNMYDVFSAGMEYNNDFYGVMGAGYHTEHIYCSVEIAVNSSYCFYSYFLEGCSYCLGCVGLKNKSFCIFNKQYTKDQRHEKVDEIFSDMEEKGILGDFFPGSMNPFYFNDTAAYLIDDSFTKEEVEEEGYLRRDEPIKVDAPEGMEVVKTSEVEKYEAWVKKSPPASLGQKEEDKMLPLSKNSPLYCAGQKLSKSKVQDYTWTIDPAILEKVIQDEQGNIYRIVKMEYDFLIRHALPLPRLHWLERLKMHFCI